MIWIDGRWQKQPKTINSYADKIRSANPKTEIELWQAMSDRDYHEVARLHKEYYQKLYLGAPINQKLRDAASLITRFRKYKKRLGIASEMDGKRYVLNKPNPDSKTWQDVWQNLTQKSYQDVFQGYLKCKKGRSYNCKYGKDFHLIRQFRKHCKTLGIKYPTAKQYYPKDHIWREPFAKT